MKTKLKIGIDRILAMALGGLLIWAFLYSQRVRRPGHYLAEAAGEPKKVAVAIAKRIEIPISVESVGTVRSRRQTTIASRVLAEVEAIRRQPGDDVEAGEVLIVLDSRDLQARVDQAQANLKSLQEALAEAKIEFERTKNLFAKEAATQQQLDMARFRFSSAAAQEDAAQKAVEEAHIQLGYATIKSPFAGLIFEKRADPGDLAQPGKPLLGLYDPRQLRMEALIDERILWTLKVKDQLEVSMDALGRTLAGEVSEVVPAVDPSTRTGMVKIDLPHIPELRPGMFGRTRIPISKRNAVVVPRSALVRRGQLQIIFTVTEDDKHARLTLVRWGDVVSGGGTENEVVEILSGLEAERRVIISGTDDLHDGDLIEIDTTTGGSRK